MIVVIGGMQRSGSTFSFNVVRDLLVARGSVHQEPVNSIIDAVARSGNSDYVIVKSHNLDGASVRLVELLAAKSICTIRKPEDAIASWIETFGFSLDESIRHMKTWLDMFNRIHRHSLVIDYETIDTCPSIAAWRIARFLGFSSPFEARHISRRHSKAAVKAVSETLAEREGVVDIGFSKYDSTTFYHRNHVSTLTSRHAADRLSSDEVHCIRNRLAGYIDDHGKVRMAS